MNYEEYEEYNDMYDGEDDAIIEAALDIYDQYEVSMEEAVDMAMESLYAKIFPYTSKKKFGKYKVDSLDIDRKYLKRNTYVRPDGLTAEEYDKRLEARKNALKDLDNSQLALKKREARNIGIGAGAVLGAGVGGVALYKYHKKKLAEAAKAEKEAEELDSRAARKREKAQKAIAQAKEAASFGYDY